MTIASLADYEASYRQLVRLTEFNSADAAGEAHWVSGALVQAIVLANDPGQISSIGNTTTGVVPTSGVTGFVDLGSSIGSATAYITQARLRCYTASSRVVVYDRLWHAGPLVSTSNYTFASQPSFAARLPGGLYTGLMLYVECVSGLGGGGPGLVVSYTNSNGVAGRLSSITDAAGIAHVPTSAGEFPLQAGDVGIRSVDGVTFTGGHPSYSYNVFIGRPLVVIRGIAQYSNDQGQGPERIIGMDQTGMVRIYADSALQTFYQADNGNNHANFELVLEIASDAAASGAEAGPSPNPYGTSTVTWNPSDPFFPAGGSLALTNGNLTATGGSNTRGTTGHSTGKYYFEVQINSYVGAYPCIGVRPLNSNLNTVGFTSGSGWSVGGNITYYDNGTSSGPWGTFATNDVVSVAVDLTAGKMWFAKNGVWLSGSPSTSTSPQFSGLTGTLYPAAYVDSGAGLQQVTARFDPSSWSFGPPSGFGPW